MTKVWTEHLAESEVKLMNEIIEQIPTEHGVREAFVNIVQKLADTSAEPRFRYLIASNHMGDVRGTNDDELANNHALDEDQYVIDVVQFYWIQADGDTQEIEELEQ